MATHSSISCLENFMNRGAWQSVGGHKLNKELQNPQLLGPGLLPVFLELTSFTKKHTKNQKQIQINQKDLVQKLKKVKPNQKPTLFYITSTGNWSFHFISLFLGQG